MDIAKLATDPKAVDGKWFTFGDAEFKLAYYNRPDFARQTSKVWKRYSKHAIDADPALVLVREIEMMAEAVLIDWKGVTNNGEPVEPTKANKILLLGHAPFREWVTEQAMKFENFAAEAEAEDASTLKSGN